MECVAASQPKKRSTVALSFPTVMSTHAVPSRARTKGSVRCLVNRSSSPFRPSGTLSSFQLGGADSSSPVWSNGT